ncbi:MAG: ABC transporter permease [Nanobdellota archaeon]
MKYIIKHIVLIKEYFRLAFKEAHEYRSQFFMNIITYILTAATWLFFWEILFANTSKIGGWTLPMLQLLTGFVLLADSFWQFGYYSIEVGTEIVEAKIDRFLIRPVNTIFAVMMSRFEIMAVIPIGTGFAVIGYALSQGSFEFTVIQGIIALLTCVFGVIIFHLVTLTISTLAFRFGRVRAFISIYRSLIITKQYPINILGIVWRNVLTFIFPAIFFGTFPVQILTSQTVIQSVKTLLLAVGVLALWSLILHISWNKGLKQYQSMGG